MDQDDDLYYAIQQLAVNKGRGTKGDSSYFDDKIEISGGIIEVKDIVNAIRVRTLEEFFEAWRVNLGRLIKFHDDHGHYEIPQKGEYEKLYSWANRQRNLKRKGILSKEIQNALNEINFDWKPYPWESRIRLLKEFYQRNGHFQLPADSEHKEFRGWMRKVREQKLAGLLNKTLDKHLKEIDFDWFDNKDWDKNLELLKKFHEEYGHFEVPENTKRKDYKALGDWVFFIRKSKVNGTLDKELMIKLYDMRFSFVPKITKRAHRKNKKIYGGGLDKASKSGGKVTKDFKNSGQRQILPLPLSEKKAKQVPPNLTSNGIKTPKLELQSFNDSLMNGDRFNTDEKIAVEVIVKHFRMNGTGPIKPRAINHPDNFAIYDFFLSKKKLAKLNKIHPETLLRLNKVNPDWTTEDSLFTKPKPEEKKPQKLEPEQPKEEILDLIQKLIDFKELHGHFDVIPSMFENYEDGLQIAGFVRGKRNAKNNQNLDAFTEKALNEIGFEWKSKKERRAQCEL
jgi:hypothetical protein